MSKERAARRRKLREAAKRKGGRTAEWSPPDFVFVAVDADEDCPICELLGWGGIHHADDVDRDDL